MTITIISRTLNSPFATAVKNNSATIKLKSFLKPDFKKVILCIILFLSFPIPYQDVVIDERCILHILFKGDCHSSAGDWKVMFFGLELVKEISRGTLSLGGWFPLFFGISIIVSYLFSCLLVFIYDKFKPLKRKRQKTMRLRANPSSKAENKR